MKRKNPEHSIHKTSAIALSAHADNLSSRATAVTVPLFRVRSNEHPESFATGVLLAVEGVKFLLTAGHIFDGLTDEHLATGLRGSVLILDGTPMRFRTPGTRDSGNDHFDLGVVELAGREWEAIP